MLGSRRIDAVDQWCLRRILDIRWHIRRITNQPPLSSIIKSRRLTFCGHLARMDENADASQAIFEPPPGNWRRPLGRLCTTWMKNFHDDLSLLDLGIYEVRLEIGCKIGLSGDWCLCTVLHTRSGACYYWIGAKNRRIMLETSYAVCMPCNGN